MKKPIIILTLIAALFSTQQVLSQNLNVTDLTTRDDLVVGDDASVAGTITAPGTAPLVLGTNGADTTITFPDGATIMWDTSEAAWVAVGDVQVSGDLTVSGIVAGVAQLEFQTVASMLNFDYSTTTDGRRVKCNGYNVANDGFFGPDVFWDATSTATADNLSVFDPIASGAGRLIRSFSGTINARYAGATGDGAADDTAYIQAVLNLNKIVYLPVGRYKITDRLVLRRSSGIIGESWSFYPDTVQTPPAWETTRVYYVGDRVTESATEYVCMVKHTAGTFATDLTAVRWEAETSVWDGTGESVIFWGGSTAASEAMLFASAEDIGIQPDSLFANSQYGIRLENFLVDGDDKIGYGIYGIRPQEWNVENVSVRGTTKHGFYLSGVFSGKYSKLAAVFNQGCGITFGRAQYDWNWTANYQVNAAVLSDFYASTNGADKAFDDATNPAWGYGIGLWLHRANALTGYTSELNDGVGIYLSPSNGPNVYRDGYVELNNYYDVSATDAVDDGRADQGWGLWIHGQSNRISSSGAITASDNTLTISSDIHFSFTASMVGETLTIEGAATGPADLTTTIASYTSATEVELTDAADLTVSGSYVLWNAKSGISSIYQIG
jgi:hypothetical protein